MSSVFQGTSQGQHNLDLTQQMVPLIGAKLKKGGVSS